jgi:hypothetical protein
VADQRERSILISVVLTVIGVAMATAVTIIFDPPTSVWLLLILVGGCMALILVTTRKDRQKK